MLTRSTRPLSAVRAFILAPSVCTANASVATSHPTNPVSSWESSLRPKSRFHLGATVYSRRVSTNPESPPSSAPYALTVAAHAFEEQVQRGELDFLAQTYSHLRKVIIEAHRRGLTHPDDAASPRMLREPEVVLKDAMVLLVTSPLQEHADLHLAMFNDLVPVFRARSEVDQPLEFAAQVFHAHLRNETLHALPRIYDHMCRLFESSPEQSDVFASESSAWRVGLWMKGLAKHPQRELTGLLPRILHDLPRVFHVQPTLLHHQLVIKGFLVRNMPDDAWNWLRQMELHAQASPVKNRDNELPSLWTKLRSFSPLRANPPADTSSPINTPPTVWLNPLSTEYDLLLRYFATRGDVVSARMLMAHMSAVGGDAAPTKHSWHLLLSALLAPTSSQDIARVVAVVEDMERVGHTVHLKTLGGVAGRGSVKGWLNGEVFDVLKAAQDKSHIQEETLRVTPDKAEDAPVSVEAERIVTRASKPANPTPARKSSGTIQKTSVRDVEPPNGHHAPSVDAAPADVTASETLADKGFTSHVRSELAATAQPLPNATSPSTPPGKRDTSADLKSAPVVAGGARTAEVSLSQTGSRPAFKMFVKKDAMSKERHKFHLDTTPWRVAAVQSVKANPSLPVSDISTSSMVVEADGSRRDRPEAAVPSHETPALAPKSIEDGYLSELSNLDVDSGELSIPLPVPPTGPEGEFSIDSESVSSEVVPPTLLVLPEISTNESSLDAQGIASDASGVDVSLSSRLTRRAAGSPLHEAPTAIPETVSSQEPDASPIPSAPASLEHIDGGEFGVASAPHPGPEQTDLSRETVQPEMQPRHHEKEAGVAKSPSQLDKPGLDARDPSTKARTKARRLASSDPSDAIVHQLSRAVHGAIQRGDLRDASKNYAELTKIARPDVYVADALIGALCLGSLRAPPRPHVMQALRIYKDLVEAEKLDEADLKGFFDGSSPARPVRPRIDARLYNTLLRALSAPPSAHVSSRDFGPEIQEEYTKFAMELLADMEARGLRPDNRTVTSILLLRFRGAKDHQEAFEYYRSLLTELEAVAAASKRTPSNDMHSRLPTSTSTPPILDVFGYRAVLGSFGRLLFPSAPIAPAHLWFSIADDMRARGYTVSVEDYTRFLKGILDQKTAPLALQRAALGIPSPEGDAERMRALYASVKYIHKKLTVDPNISPDAPLLNTLMNVYQHLGAFDDALRVFNTMWLSGRMSDVTPIIVFDACGHAGRHQVASVIWCKLVAKGWEFDKRTLDTWVECLCRTGYVEAACRFVCVYMGREKAGYLGKGDTRPDVQTCLILLKLSWVERQNLAVKERIRAHLPHLWDKLASDYT